MRGKTVRAGTIKPGKARLSCWVYKDRKKARVGVRDSWGWARVFLTPAKLRTFAKACLQIADELASDKKQMDAERKK